jgi:hypothetical protein
VGVNERGQAAKKVTNGGNKWQSNVNTTNDSGKATYPFDFKSRSRGKPREARPSVLRSGSVSSALAFRKPSRKLTRLFQSSGLF